MQVARPLALLVFLAAPPVAADPPDGLRVLAAQPAPLVERLRREHFVLLQDPDAAEKARDGLVQGLVLFVRPRDEVLSLLIQGTRQAEYRPELRDTRVVEQRPAGQVIAYRMRMLLMTIDYRTIFGWDLERGEVWWELDPRVENDFARLDGRWQVYSLDEGSSLGRFGTRIDVGPMLPAALQTLATRRKLPETMHNVRRWIDSGGTWRP